MIVGDQNPDHGHVGRAGAGKTTAACTITDAHRDQGYEVRVAAPAGKAAEGLEREAAVYFAHD